MSFFSLGGSLDFNIFLGCTEIEMLIKKNDLDIPIFDTTQAHINSIVNYILQNL